jgi:hypothetical protein
MGYDAPDAADLRAAIEGAAAIHATRPAAFAAVAVAVAVAVVVAGGEGGVSGFSPARNCDEWLPYAKHSPTEGQAASSSRRKPRS